jgi:hypothetical protein
LIESADRQWSDLLWEFESGQRALYVDALAFGKDADGYYIKVNTGEPVKVASSFGGVRIITEVVGDIRALDRSRVRS